MKKYAVYRGETGFFCYLYCDTVESLKDTIYANIIKEEQLPVVMDGKGGFFAFRETDPGFTEIVETDDVYPLPLEKMFFKNADNFKLGWMSPDGDTYSCNYTGHEKCAKMLADCFFPGARLPERALGRAGWLKIIDSWNGTQRQHRQFVYSLSGRLTKQQADRLFDLGLYGNREVQEMLHDSENSW
ncbi:MAG: hypothetical protein MJ071_09915 [Oscillospiraceae bacterium]|nr:hypothetical protein [Oscillospiraceae bacterium]